MAVNDKSRPSTLEWARQDIVEYILLLCIAEVRFDDLKYLMISLSPIMLKIHLFYLIDYDLISYNGQKRVYMIKSKGLRVLSKLLADKRKV